MIEELFDIVDEYGNLLGIQKPRSLVHAEQKDWHRTTHIWIVNDQGQFLCQQRSLKKDANPGSWQQFFGGHLKAGQTYESNALEELYEELGLKINPRQLIPIRIGKDEDYKHLGQVYLLHWNGNPQDLQIDKDEVEKVEWYDKEKLQQDFGLDEEIMKALNT